MLIMEKPYKVARIAPNLFAATLMESAAVAQSYPKIAIDTGLAAAYCAPLRLGEPRCHSNTPLSAKHSARRTYTDGGTTGDFLSSL